MIRLVHIATISICCHDIEIAIMLFTPTICLAAKFERQGSMIFAEQVQFSY